MNKHQVVKTESCYVCEKCGLASGDGDGLIGAKCRAVKQIKGKWYCEHGNHIGFDCGGCTGYWDSPSPTKPSGWESSFNDAFLLRKNKWGAPKLAKYFPQQLHPDLVKDFVRSLLREKAGEIRGMKEEMPSTLDSSVAFNLALEEAARLLIN